MNNLNLFRYQIPFKKPLVTGNGTYSKREGLLLQFKNGNLTSWGEIAPLPGFSDESLDDCISWIEQHQQLLNSSFTDGLDKEANFINWDSFPHFAPKPVQFGWDCLLAGTRSHLTQRPVSALLSENPAQKVSFNKLASLADLTTESDIKMLSDELESARISALKLKIGDLDSSSLEKLALLKKLGPNINLRLDPNGSWSFQQLKNHIKELEELDPEYIEQPFHVDDFTGYKKMRKKTNLRIALDESVWDLNSAEFFLRTKLPDFIIVKPMFWGSLNNISRLKKLADHFGVELIFTTALESAVGRFYTSHIAAAFGTTGRAHGLHTGPLLKQDFWEDKQWIKNGAYLINQMDPLPDSITGDEIPLEEVTL